MMHTTASLGTYLFSNLVDFGELLLVGHLVFWRLRRRGGSRLQYGK